MLKVRNAAPTLTLALLVTASLAAQERRQGGPPPYDPANEVTVSGIVTSTETIEVGTDKRRILMMTVQGAPMGVILGPDAWVERQGVPFEKGVTVHVTGLTGYKVNGNPALMPRSVKAGSKILTLRDGTGKPLWDQ